VRASKAAPPTREQGHEDAGTTAAATGRGLQAVAETSSEFGGALGIAVLGSIAAAVYRHELSVHGQVGETIGDVLGGGGDLGAARDAFVQGMHVAAGVSALLVAVATAAVLALLRGDRSLSPSTDRPVAVGGAA
jgi:MFS transporter, DHA2 family, multidrug resistance protein